MTENSAGVKGGELAVPRPGLSLTMSQEVQEIVCLGLLDFTVLILHYLPCLFLDRTAQWLS